MKLFRISVLSVLAFLLAGQVLAMGQKEAAPQRPVLAVSILPQAWFLERLVGDRADILVLVGPGQSPHSYEPTPRQMADLARAKAWFTIGVEFEHALEPRIAELYPKLAIVETTGGVVYRHLEDHEHEHEEDGEHADDETDVADDDHDAHEGHTDDPHVWLGRQAVLAMADTMLEALNELDPAGRQQYAAGHAALVRDVEQVYGELAAVLAPQRGTTVFVYHPAFGYLLDEFGIRQEAVETGGKEPTQAGLLQLIRSAREDQARVIFVQAQFPASAAKTVADAIGGRVVSIDPLAPDWLDNLRRLGQALAASGN